MVTLISMLSHLPMYFLYGISKLVYFLFYFVLRTRRRVVIKGLSNSFPEKTDGEIRQICKTFYQNYADVLVEMIKSLRIEAQQVGRRVEFQNAEAILEQLEDGQAILVCVAHQCNIEWLLIAVCNKFDFPMDVIYRPISNKSVERLMIKTYTRFGANPIDDRSVVKQLMQRRKLPRIVVIAADQSPQVKDNTVWTNFLNQETGFFAAPETIASFVGYPVFFLGMRRLKRGNYSAWFKQIAKPPYRDQKNAIVNAYIHEVESQIIEQPSDWFWAHNRWKRKKPLYS